MNEIRSVQSRLDSIRLTEGTVRCQAVFAEICKRDKVTAATLINDQRLTFPSLFILLPQIESFRLYPRLSPIKKIASSITAHILKPGGNAGYLTEKNSAEYTALKWILETSKLEDGNDYEDVLDVTVSVLINMYKDKTILPDVCDMIFARCSKGHHIHDLVWAYFRSSDPYAIKLVAQRMVSPRDSALALSLLGIKAQSFGADTKKQLEAYLRWLDENGPFLYFTDESFQLTSSPVFYSIDLERKYMQKNAPSYIKQPVAASDNHESNCLAAFRRLDNEDKQLLSDYSHKLHSDLSKWKMWMALPVEQQLKAATLSCGGVV